MSAERSSWRSVAMALADRLQNHAYCVDAAHKDPRQFPECPFCRDRVAYRWYLTRLAQDRETRS